MKLHAALLASLLLIPPASNASEAPAISGDESCALLGKFAASSMKARQMELPISRSLELLDQSASGNTKVILREIILTAYERPGYSSEVYQEREVRRYENEVVLGCLRGQ